MLGVNGEQIADTSSWQKIYKGPLSSSLVAGTAISAGHSSGQGGRTRCVLTAERSLHTTVLTSVATSHCENWENRGHAEGFRMQTTQVFRWFNDEQEISDHRRIELLPLLENKIAPLTGASSLIGRSRLQSCTGCARFPYRPQCGMSERPSESYQELPGTAGKKAERWFVNQAMESGDLGPDNLQSMDPWAFAATEGEPRPVHRWEPVR